MLHQEGNLKVCPYNPSHVIRPKRMITHLTKCRKNYLSLGYQICPMDATHHVPPEEFEEHLEKCPKRALVDVALCDQSSNPPANPILSPERVKAVLVPTEENWDDDYVPPYDPHANAESKNVVRILTNAPRAAKRAFQKADIKRLIDLQAKEAAEGPLSNVGRREEDTDNVRMPSQRSEAFVRVMSTRTN